MEKCTKVHDHYILLLLWNNKHFNMTFPALLVYSKGGHDHCSLY